MTEDKVMPSNYQRVGALVDKEGIIYKICWQVVLPGKPTPNIRYVMLSHPEFTALEFNTQLMQRPRVDLDWEAGMGFVRGKEVLALPEPKK